MKNRAKELAEAMKTEDGVRGAVKAFYKHFPWGEETERPSGAMVSGNKHHHSMLSLRQCFGFSSTAEDGDGR